MTSSAIACALKVTSVRCRLPLVASLTASETPATNFARLAPLAVGGLNSRAVAAAAIIGERASSTSMSARRLASALGSAGARSLFSGLTAVLSWLDLWRSEPARRVGARDGQAQVGAEIKTPASGKPAGANV